MQRPAYEQGARHNIMPICLKHMRCPYIIKYKVVKAAKVYRKLTLQLETAIIFEIVRNPWGSSPA